MRCSAIWMSSNTSNHWTEHLFFHRPNARWQTPCNLSNRLLNIDYQTEVKIVQSRATCWDSSVNGKHGCTDMDHEFINNKVTLYWFRFSSHASRWARIGEVVCAPGEASATIGVWMTMASLRTARRNITFHLELDSSLRRSRHVSRHVSRHASMHRYCVLLSRSTARSFF